MQEENDVSLWSLRCVSGDVELSLCHRAPGHHTPRDIFHEYIAEVEKDPSLPELKWFMRLTTDQEPHAH